MKLWGYEVVMISEMFANIQDDLIKSTPVQKALLLLADVESPCHGSALILMDGSILILNTGRDKRLNGVEYGSRLYPADFVPYRTAAASGGG